MFEFRRCGCNKKTEVEIDMGILLWFVCCVVEIVITWTVLSTLSDHHDRGQYQWNHSTCHSTHHLLCECPGSPKPTRHNSHTWQKKREREDNSKARRKREVEYVQAMTPKTTFFKERNHEGKKNRTFNWNALGRAPVTSEFATKDAFSNGKV